MDEVDKIIIHSLRDIGLTDIDDETTSIAAFTPEMVVRATAACLQQIKPNDSLPKFLPAGMAMRFAAATALAEECASCGYRNDIGYQSFLYPNTVDVRRLLMFLIEHLPKENQQQGTTDFSKTLSDKELLHCEVKAKIQQQLRSAWVPQYCRFIGNQRQNVCSSMYLPFTPQLNLNIPSNSASDAIASEVRTYLEQQAPNIFMQTATATDCDLISTVQHKNDLDLFNDSIMANPEQLQYSLISLSTTGIVSSPVHQTKSNDNDENRLPKSDDTTTEQSRTTAALSRLDTLTENMNKLKSENEELLAQRKAFHTQINAIKLQIENVHKNNEHLRSEVKMHERTCLVLENPTENVDKLAGLIKTTIERRKTLEQQFQSYRQPLVFTLQHLQTSKQAKNAQNVADLREVILQLEQQLKEKTAEHSKFVVNLKNAEMNISPRKEYTRRILEFIGNIRKQRNDIFKVLDDTRDLQKQLNSVTGQLQRQFNYTDDLLFQSAKHDVHAKKAYKLLASLHSTCNDLVELVSQTGNIAKEIRDLESQIDRERSKNIAVSLERISADIRNFENVIKNVQLEIKNIEDN